MDQNKENRIDGNGFVYIVECCDGTYYTGWTTDIGQRLKSHNRGKGAKYTRSRRPVSLVYLEKIEGKGNGLRREAAIKKLKREEKRRLIGSEQNFLRSAEGQEIFGSEEEKTGSEE